MRRRRAFHGGEGLQRRILLAGRELRDAKGYLRVLRLCEVALFDASLDGVDRVVILAAAPQVLAIGDKRVAIFGGVRLFLKIGEIGRVLCGFRLRLVQEAHVAIALQQFDREALLGDGLRFHRQVKFERKLGHQFIVIRIAHIARGIANAVNVEILFVREAAGGIRRGQQIGPVLRLALQNEPLSHLPFRLRVARFGRRVHQQGQNLFAVAKTAQLLDGGGIIAHQIIGLRDNDLAAEIQSAALAQARSIRAHHIAIAAGIIVGGELRLAAERAAA